MKILISGKQLDLGEALQTHVQERLAPAIAKYYEEALEARITFRREAHMYHAEIAVHVGAGIDAQAAAEDAEIYASFDSALARMEKQLRRDKRKRRNHHAGPPGRAAGEA